MTKCLFKALKAVDLEKYLELFRSLGYESAGALAHFRAEHFEKLNFNEQELLRLISLLDVLKDSTREGKICPHYFNSTKTTKPQSTTIKSIPICATWSDETNQKRNFQTTMKKQINNENSKSKRSVSSIGTTDRLSSMSITTKINKNHSNDFVSQRSSTVLSRQHPITPLKMTQQRLIGPKSFLTRPTVQHVKVKSYNYGVPTTRRSRNNFHRLNHQNESHFHHGSIFVSSSHHSNDISSYGKPAEIYVYARKRPLLPTETNFQDSISVPDNKRVIITENKANLDCSPLLKKTEFQFDQSFGSDVTNKQIFESTVLPFLSKDHRHNLTYICFGQTGSGKSHTIFGSKNTDGLLIYCTQLLLQEINFENNLICSFYEIYNNQVYDLINTGKRLFVREDGEHHVNVIGRTEIILKSLDDLHSVIDDGLTKRHHGKSAFNSNSSRSHAIFQLILKNNYDSSENFKLVFIDLAGSERATDAQNNQRQTRREGAQINWSLLALKECIRSMDMTHSHAPFRQSKLTHILRDSLVGSKTRTCLMGNVSPADDCCQCSLNTLQYASRIRDISIRYRHRIMPKINSFDDNIKEREFVREKPQRTFKPATASTPVHRLISSIDQRIYLSTNQTDVDVHTTKPLDIDWQIADDDVPITGGGDNLPLTYLSSSTREFLSNSKPIQSNNLNLNRYQQSKTTKNEMDDDLSSYFPLPQTDIKKSSTTKTKSSLTKSRLLHDDGNDRQWKSVSAPTKNRFSNSSTAPTNSTRFIPVSSFPIPDENPYSSATGTESLGTKIKEFATNDQKSTIENFHLNKQFGATSITTTNNKRERKSKNEATFSTNREKLLFILSNRLSTNKTQNRFTNSTKPRNSFSSTNKIRSKPRSMKSASSTTSLTNVNNQDNKKSKVTSSINLQKFDSTKRRLTNHSQQQRTVPFHVYHSSDSEDFDKKRLNVHHQRTPEVRQTMKNEQQHKDENFLDQQKNTEQISSLASENLVQAPLDQVQRVFNRTLQQPISPLTSTNINNPWPISSFYSSPSKDFGIRVSDQLNSLRALLETRLVEHDESKHQTSPGKFTQEFLQPFGHSSLKTNLTEFFSDIDDDDNEVARNFVKLNQNDTDHLSTSTISSNPNGFLSTHHHFEQIIQPSLSSFSTELNQAKVSLSATQSSTSTITSNLAAKLDTHEPRIFSSQDHDIPSFGSSNNNQQVINADKNLDKISNNPISDSGRTSQVNSSSQNPFTGTSSEGSSSNHSRTRSPIVIPPFSTTNTHDHLLDSGKGSSFLTGSSFDALLNSLKTMREKDLSFVVRTGDDKLIPVVD